MARRSGDVAAATAVFNLAALLASDCGMPDLARTWCHRLATVALAHDSDPRHALEPVVNLARLHIRAGDGRAAWTLLETLFQAIDTRRDTVIDGLTIPAAHLTDPPGTYATVRSWLWGVLLGTGAHALATAGRWDEASHRLAHYRGVGARMLDGRQITLVAHVVAGRYQQARAMLSATHPGEPCETAVTACLRLHVPAEPRTDALTDALTAYHALGPTEPGLAVFRTRLGLTLIDALDAGHPDGEQTAADLIRHAADDGYAARDVLAHPRCLDVATSRQTAQLANLVSACGLDLATMPAAHLTALNRALDTAESVVTGHTRTGIHHESRCRTAATTAAPLATPGASGAERTTPPSVADDVRDVCSPAEANPGQPVPPRGIAADRWSQTGVAVLGVCSGLREQGHRWPG